MFCTGFAEIVLIVEDVKRSFEFYRDVVGLEVLKEADDEWAWLWIGKPEKGQRIGLHKGKLLFEEHSPYPEGERWGRVHYALHVPRDRIEEALEHVRSHDVEVYGPKEFPWMNAIGYYFYDPDGNLLEFWSEE